MRRRRSATGSSARSSSARTSSRRSSADRSELPEQQRHLLRKGVWLIVTAISLYLVAPSVIAVAGSWDDVAKDLAGLARRHVRVAGGDGRVPVGAAARDAASARLVADRHLAAVEQRALEGRAGRRGGRRRAAVPDAGRARVRRQPRRRRPHDRQPPDARRRPGDAGARRSRRSSAASSRTTSST